MKTSLLIIFSVFISLPVFCQQKNDNYYRLNKGGTWYPKIIRQVRLNEKDAKELSDNSLKITFVINGEIFRYIADKHDIDTLSIAALKKIEFSTIKDLKEDEYQEHKKRTQQENLRIPPPLSHYNIKIYIVEKISDKKMVKYEVEWIYSIQ